MKIKINDTYHIKQDSVQFVLVKTVLKEECKTPYEQNIGYFSNLKEALKRAFQLTNKSSKIIELKDLDKVLNEKMDKFLSGITIEEFKKEIKNDNIKDS